jgi:hypothetical protein
MNTYQANRSWLNPLLLVIAVFIGASSASAPQQTENSDSRPTGSASILTFAEDDLSSPRNLPTTVSPSKPASGQSILPVRAPHNGVLENLFSGHNWYTPPPPAPVTLRSEPVKRAPTAPPLPFSYIGRYEQEGAGTLFYLVKDDRVYDVRIGDVIDNTYRVDRVLNGQLLFTYIPLNSSQGLRLGEE